MSPPDTVVVWQAVEGDAEELSKWSRAMKRCQQHLADSARFAAWHNVNPLLSLPLAAPQLALRFDKERRVPVQHSLLPTYPTAHCCSSFSSSILWRISCEHVP